MLDHNQFMQVSAADGISPQNPGVLCDGKTAQGATFNTAAFYVGDATLVSITFSCPSTGTPVGTATLQVSNDPATNQQVGMQFPDAGLVNWVSLLTVDPTTGAAFSSKTVPVSSATTVVLNLAPNPYRWVRVAYAKTSGTVTPTITIQTKRY